MTRYQLGREIERFQCGRKDGRVLGVSGPCGNTRIKTTRTSIEFNHQITTTIPSNRARIDADLVEPTQYNVQPNQTAKKPPKPWPLPKILRNQKLRIPQEGHQIQVV